MWTRIINTWDSIRASFWFVPAVFSVLAMVLGWVLPVLDARLGTWVPDNAPWLASTAPGARTLLATLAGALVTVAGVVLSLTTVALSVTTAQFGSRLLRSFVTDPVTHFSFGILVASSLYCFVVLRTVQEKEPAFAPHLAVALGLLLGLACLGTLIYFTHHVAGAIQVPVVVEHVVHDLDQTIERLYPDLIEDCPGVLVDREAEIEALGDDSVEVASTVEGYLQSIDTGLLIEAARKDNGVLAMYVRPGDFITGADRIARFWPSSRAGEKLEKDVNLALLTGTYRTPRQDLECSIDEVVELGVRALSPGINDPFTAITCIDRLSAALGRLARRRWTSPLLKDEEGVVRVIALPFTFPGALAAGFNLLRQYGRSSAAVDTRLLEGLETIARRVAREEDREAVIRQAQMIRDGALIALPDENDREDVEQRFRQVVRTLKQSARVAV